MKAWLWKWLPIFFGCHCRDDRSFHYHGKKFPICARCTGQLVGLVVAIVSLWFYVPPIWVSLVLLIPLVVDGFVQLLTRYESNNIRRLITGILFGYGLLCFFIALQIACFRFGFSLTHR